MKSAKNILRQIICAVMLFERSIMFRAHNRTVLMVLESIDSVLYSLVISLH